MGNPFDSGFYGSEELRTFGFAHVGEGVQVAKTCKIVGLDRISIGDGSRIDDFTMLIAGGGHITIADHVHIHAYCQIGGRGGVTMESYSALASGCLVYSASDDPSGEYMVGGVAPPGCTKPRVAPVVLRQHAVAFSRCTILPGTTFGEGAVACAQSLVSRRVPEWTIVSGSPAVHRRDRSRRLLTFLDVPVEEMAA